MFARLNAANVNDSKESLVRLSPLSLKILLNLFLVYVSWGSTYIGFKFTLEVLGPFLACGARMVLAGVVLSAAIACAGRWKRPARADWLHALWLGLFMVLMASGFLAKGQESITSGVAAVVTGSTPISMLVAAWLFGGERRPSAMQWLGLAGGLCGLILLGKSHGVGVGPDHSSMGGILWVFGATLGWVAGSLLTRRFPPDTRLGALQSCGLLLCVGGLECLLVGFMGGEAALTRWENLRPGSDPGFPLDELRRLNHCLFLLFLAAGARLHRHGRVLRVCGAGHRHFPGLVAGQRAGHRADDPGLLPDRGLGLFRALA